jgi:hypothetical protein
MISSVVVLEAHLVAGVLAFLFSAFFFVVAASSELRRWIDQNRHTYRLIAGLILGIVIADLAGLF